MIKDEIKAFIELKQADMPFEVRIVENAISWSARMTTFVSSSR